MMSICLKILMRSYRDGTMIVVVVYSSLYNSELHRRLEAEIGYEKVSGASLEPTIRNRELVRASRRASDAITLVQH